MKRIKFAFAAALLLMVVTLTSCLGDDDNNQKIVYYANVTVMGDATAGFRLFVDGGTILKVSDTTGKQYADLAKVKRAYVAFSLAEGFTIPNPVTEQTVYEVDLIGWQEISASEVIDLYDNADADTLITRDVPVYTFDMMTSYRGYVTTKVNVYWSGNRKQLPYFNLGFDSRKDIVKDTLFLTLYYDRNSESTSIQSSSANSFLLPQGLYSEFSKNHYDSIVVAVKASVTSPLERVETQYAKIPTGGILVPTLN